jgi:lactate permease
MDLSGQISTLAGLFGAANTSGGVVAKMISPRNLAIGTAAVGEVGAEGVLFLLAMCLQVFLQSTPILGWMRVGG